MKTINQYLEETLIHECKTGGFSAKATAEALAKLHAGRTPVGDQPAPPHIVAMCDAMMREATREMEILETLAAPNSK